MSNTVRAMILFLIITETVVTHVLLQKWNETIAWVFSFRLLRFANAWNYAVHEQTSICSKKECA